MADDGMRTAQAGVGMTGVGMTGAGTTGSGAGSPGTAAFGGGVPGSGRPAGLGLTLGAGDAFKVVVTDAAGSALLELGPFDEDEVVATWRSLSAASGLPLLVGREDGSWHQAYPQIGRLLVGQRIERRRLGVLSGRRPRFLVRRKPARLPGRPVIHREKEIATGRGR